jgi:4-hydroxy-2-oxoheptanedioate aldolase
MAEKMRYNKIIDLLEHGKPVFSTSTVPNGSLDDLTYIADADYDAVIIEMEHEGFSFTTLRTSLQVLLNRKRIAEKGNLQPDVVPMVRIPPNARERNQWVIKQALDTGVYGLVLPHLSTVEDAQAAVAAARYPQVPGVQDFAPAGERGWGNRIASRYWGLTPQEYYDAADLWPLDPEGNILLMGIIEEADQCSTDRWNLASTTFPDAGPMVRIRFPPAGESAANSTSASPFLDDQSGSPGNPVR